MIVIPAKVLAATVLAASVGTLQIEDVRLGALDRATKVVSEGTTIPYQENGECTVGGVKGHCMWWGLAFSYTGLPSGKDVACDVTFSQPGHRSDIHHRQQQPLSHQRIALGLHEPSGTFLGEYYLQKEPGDSGILTITMDCAYLGRHLFNRSFTVELGGP